MEFSLTDLAKRFWHFAWLIVLCVILFAGAGFAYAKSGKVITNFSASRMVLIAKTNTDVRDPSSRVQADKALVPTYQKVAQDDAIVTAVQKALPFKMSKSDISSAVNVQNPTDTVALSFQASGENTYRAKTLANVYAETFANVGPTLYPDMGKPDVLSKATGSDVTRSALKNAKKLTVFGAVFGLVLSVFVILVSGIRKNYHEAKKQG
ncbi:YveK family protein [Fructobacillus evanidus]|uniref:Capsular polysaccharide biosynthesis protein YveK (YveK) n=1 Tax=Fructobacillus evanidus TaxID=3064281 RepID=A0ABM9N2J4_9LACO|nr:Capsular polysaccharide biosynthesis protein YveK (YveK) [Fructobacillus sp. LMG 32999]CAK1250620.1 Capsular polysaccharide biosynthesis protein YveK (YveK) [Fructobacillus sp. LMG 32999]CAK1254322.1 Capsular polysaccharide biosynthesis protein YveK (YveK) [Fructobacillus sp. LMG 32999]CAK1254327.1 Capsular polysaccharide biosynthesis protein YveK (YveK) [Fructobacillus sp. LMG 32999]CAK1254678.1 Capsular polysaccharide biosynthesis protein YveK (YveK) [Fructobacillus sp. LMG 32999]